MTRQRPSKKIMERKEDELFDARGFFELLGDLLRQRLLDHEALRGVLVARIHVRDGEPWAVSVRFDDEAKRQWPRRAMR